MNFFLEFSCISSDVFKKTVLSFVVKYTLLSFNVFTANLTFSIIWQTYMKPFAFCREIRMATVFVVLFLLLLLLWTVVESLLLSLLILSYSSLRLLIFVFCLLSTSTSGGKIMLAVPTATISFNLGSRMFSFCNTKFFILNLKNLPVMGEFWQNLLVSIAVRCLI